VCLILDRCRQYKISLNLKKHIFCKPFGIILGDVVCKHGFLVNPTNIVVIVHFPPLNSVKQLRNTLGHTGYYRKFIKGYKQNIAPMEKLLKKEELMGPKSL